MRFSVFNGAVGLAAVLYQIGEYAQALVCLLLALLVLIVPEK
jgi:hypothetical protein